MLKIVLCVMICLACIGCAPGYSTANSGKEVKPKSPIVSPVATTGMTVTGGVAVAGGVAATVMGQPAIGLPLIAGGISLTALGLTIAKFGGIIALGTLVLILGGLVVFLFKNFKKYKAGFAEVVEGIQNVKLTLGLDSKVVGPILDDPQSEITTKLVKLVKSKLPKPDVVASVETPAVVV